jgi:porin
MGGKAQGDAGLMRGALAVALASVASPAMAEERDEDGVALEVAYTAEVFTGGGKGGGPYVDNLDIILDARKEGTKLHLYGLYNNGKDLSGPRFPRGYVASNIETGVKAARLYEAWIEQEFADGKLSVLGGLYDLNSEFDALEASALFINPAHGIGTDFSQSGANGPSIFPSTSLALRVQAKPSKALTLRAAILDGVPGDPARPKRTAIKLGKGDGTLLAFEGDLKLGKWRLIAGHWRYTARFEELDSAVERRGNQGVYLRGEGKLDDKFSAFFRLGRASGRFNEVRDFASAGVTAKGLFKGRAEDEAGLALVWGGSAPRARALQARLGAPISKSEWSVEATYAVKLTDWLTLQPDLQYLINPAFERGRKSWVAGMRVALARQF